MINNSIDHVTDRSIRIIFAFVFFFFIIFFFRLRLLTFSIGKDGQKFIENLIGRIEGKGGVNRRKPAKFGEIEFFSFERTSTSTSGSISACREQFR